MHTLGIFALLLTFSLTCELCALEQVGNLGYEISCSAGLLCTLSDKQALCVPDDLMKLIQGPILNLTRMRSKTVLHCTEEENCSPCVRVELDMSVLGSLQQSDREDGQRQSVEEGEAEDEDSFSEGSTSYDSHNSNGTFIKTLLIFSQTHPSEMCVAAKVHVPLAFLQQNLHKEHVGTVVFDCFETVPRAEVHLQSYTSPRFTKKLEFKHSIPDCGQLRQMGDVKNCQVPILQISIQKDAVIGVRNVSKVREFKLRFYYNQSPRGFSEWENDSPSLSSDSNYSISHLDIVPCLCVEAWWTDMWDAPRKGRCPFWNYLEYEENIWRKSNLILEVRDKLLMWKFEAPCNVLGEIVLCWRSTSDSRCQEIPRSRQKILVNEQQEFKALIQHPALCVQVWRKGKVWHTQCPHEKRNKEDYKDGWERNNVLVMLNQSSVPNISICILEGGSCISLVNSNTNLHKAEFLERRLLEDSLSDECEMVWSPHGNISDAILLCPLDKYMRLHLNLAWSICVLIAICVFLLLMLQYRRLKEWLKYLKVDYNSPGFVNSRRVLILYFPDHAAFERLVSTFASALQDLHFQVTVDLWHRSNISAVGPLGWFHSQRKEVLEQNGIIVFLLSKGALEKCTEWLLLGKERQSLFLEEPHTTFAASLNCVISSFLDQEASGDYIITCFEDLFSKKDIPHLFQNVPVFPLPSQLTRFLVTVAGGHKMVTSKDLLKKHSKRISHKLTDAIRKCKHS